MSSKPTAKALPGKTDRSKYRIVHGTELHKGFYCDDNNFANLREIDYDGHLTQIDDEEHLTSAECLLRGVMLGIRFESRSDSRIQGIHY